MIDLRSAGKLSQLYPGRVLLVKYEELVRQPTRALAIILQFLGLPWHPAMTKFIEDHMTRNLQGNDNDLHTKSLNSSVKVWHRKSGTIFSVLESVYLSIWYRLRPTYNYSD